MNARRRRLVTTGKGRRPGGCLPPRHFRRAQDPDIGSGVPMESIARATRTPSAAPRRTHDSLTLKVEADS